MKTVLFFLLSFFISQNLFSQISDDSLCNLAIKKLKQEGEISKSVNYDKCNGAFYTRTILSDSTQIPVALIVKFGVTSAHAKHFLCYLYGDKIRFAESSNLSENLIVLGALFSTSKISKADQFIIVEKLISEIKFDSKQIGNVPQNRQCPPPLSVVFNK